MRIRTIKPAFYKNEKLAELPLSARMLFVGLWGLADREGRLEYRPKYIKAEIFPYDDFDIVSLLEALSETGFIFIYGVENVQFIQVINFSKHQRINGKEASEKSTFPAPPERRKTGKQRGSNREAIENQLGSTGRERKGKEGKGKELSDIAAKLPAALVSDHREPPPHVQFVEGFQAVYQEMTGQPFKVDRKHWVIAANLVKANGYDPCVEKARVLGQMCRDRSAWFTKNDGFGAFTLETLSSKWNSIIPEAAQPTKEQELIDEIRRQEEQRELANNLVDG